MISGASAGIGTACAHSLAAAGLDLIVLARRADKLSALKKEIERVHGRRVEAFAVDVRDQNAVAELAEFTRDRPVDVLINNAGLAKGTDPVAKGTLADWDQMIDTNVKGLLYLTRAVLPRMIARGAGHVVNIGSVAGRHVYPGGAVYCATKFAVRALTEGLRLDLMGTPIRVTNISPGMVETEFSAVRLNDEARAKALYEGMRPLSAADVAETVTWCLSRPAHVNVQELVIYPTDQAGVGFVSRRS